MNLHFSPLVLGRNTESSAIFYRNGPSRLLMVQSGTPPCFTILQQTRAVSFLSFFSLPQIDTSPIATSPASWARRNLRTPVFNSSPPCSNSMSRAGPPDHFGWKPLEHGIAIPGILSVIGGVPRTDRRTSTPTPRPRRLGTESRRPNIVSSRALWGAQGKKGRGKSGERRVNDQGSESPPVSVAMAKRAGSVCILFETSVLLV